MANSPAAAAGQCMYSATVVIITKNRKEDLRQALGSCRIQSVPIEVVVIDDGSTDGTPDLVRSEFPEVRFHRSESSRGYIGHRNLGARMATAPIVVSIDDDAIFTTPDTVSQLLRDFDHPRVGAVFMPFRNVRVGEHFVGLAPDDVRRWVVADYVGTAHAVRRDVFLKLSGYREVLFHQGEESDYCIRLLGAGYVVRMGRSDEIHHFTSPARSVKRMKVYGARNAILFAWHNVPMPYLIIQVAGRMLNQLMHGVRSGHPLWAVEGIAKGLRDSFAERRMRRPVMARIFRLYRSLRLGIRELSQVEAELPPIGGDQVASNREAPGGLNSA